MESEKEALVREVERIRNHWVSLSVRTLQGDEFVTMDEVLASTIKKASSAISGVLSEEELRILMHWSLGGVAHSFLVMLDGATVLADKMRLSVRGPSGDELAEGLHELLDE